MIEAGQCCKFPCCLKCMGINAAADSMSTIKLA